MNPDYNELLLKFKDSFRSFSTDFAYNAVGGDNIYIESCIDSFFKALKENNSISNIKNKMLC